MATARHGLGGREPTEHQIQSAFVRAFRYRWPHVIICSFPNAARRSFALAARMKKEGLLAGMPDIFIARMAQGYGGLFLEFKSKRGRVSPEQEKVMGILGEAGYLCHVVRSVEDAMKVTEVYMFAGA